MPQRSWPPCLQVSASTSEQAGQHDVGRRVGKRKQHADKINGKMGPFIKGDNCNTHENSLGLNDGS